MEFFKLITGLIPETQGLLPAHSLHTRAAAVAAVHTRMTLTGRFLCTRHVVGTALLSLENANLTPCHRQSGGRGFRAGGGWPCRGNGAARGPWLRPHTKPCPCALILHLSGTYFPSFIQQIHIELLLCASPTLRTELHQLQSRKGLHKVG